MTHCNHSYISTQFLFCCELLTSAAASFSRLSHFFYVSVLAQIATHFSRASIYIPANEFHTTHTHSVLMRQLYSQHISESLHFTHTLLMRKLCCNFGRLGIGVACLC